MSSVSSLQSYPSRFSVPDLGSQTDAGNAKSVIDSGLKLPAYHLKFYIQEEMATFLIEDRLFRMHHHFLVRESDKFKSTIMRQESADAAIPLPDVTCLEFECLLEFFYNGMHEDYDPDVEEWLALLSISTKYGMDKIRQRATSQLDNQPEHIDPIDKILLAKRHGIDRWLAPAYAALCQRAEPLQLCEAERLGLSTTVKLARAREMQLAQTLRGSVANFRPDSRTLEPPSIFASPPPRSPAMWLPNPINVHAAPSNTETIVNEVFWPKLADDAVITPKKGKKKKGKQLHN